MALSITPGIAICIFIYVKDKYNKESLGLLLVSFILSMFSTIPVIILQKSFGISIESLADNGTAQIAFFAIKYKLNNHLYSQRSLITTLATVHPKIFGM